MDSTVLTILALISGLVIGAAALWFSSRGQLQTAATVADGLRTQLNGILSERDEAKRELEKKRSDLETANLDKARLERDTDNFEKRIKELREAREELVAQFKATSGEVVSKAQEEFLKRAEERFRQSEETGEQKIKALLDPVGKEFEKLTKKVDEVETKRLTDFGNIEGLIQTMKEGQDQVRTEAQRLGNSLRAAPKASGRWGELQVRNVLEKCGLSEKYDYVAEKAAETEDGRIRPDLIVDVPGGKKVIIDSKNIWKDYDRALATDDDTEKDKALRDHVNAVKTHIKALALRGYHAGFEGTSDYVVLFIPGEHLLYSALEKDSGLWNFAFENNVLLATPTNLVAICRTIATVWQQEGLANDAQEIGKIGSNLYDSLAKTQEDIGKMGTALDAAVSRYNDFSKTYDSSVLSRARMLKEKHIKLKKREVAEEVKLIEKTPTPPSKAIPADQSKDAKTS